MRIFFQITQLPMLQEWIEIQVLLANVSGKLRSNEAHWEYPCHELPEEDTNNIDADLTKLLNLYNQGVRMPAPTEPVVPIPTPVENGATVALAT